MRSASNIACSTESTTLRLTARGGRQRRRVNSQQRRRLQLHLLQVGFLHQPDLVAA